MKYWMLLCCLFVAGCSKTAPSNIVDTADKEALDAYEKSLAEADAMQAGDKDFKN